MQVPNCVGKWDTAIRLEEYDPNQVEHAANLQLPHTLHLFL